MFRRVLLSVLCVLTLFSPAFAAADPQSKERYDLKILLHVEHHRLLTDVFVDRLQRELGDWLQEAVGELAQVRIFKPDPALAAAMEKGLHTLDPVRDPSLPKTHFVMIRYLKGQYEIQTRQFDGLTGLWSPVRADRTRAPDVVSKRATSLVYRDFGVVGTVSSAINDETPVKVELKGGELGVHMSRWVKEKEVFALVPIQANGTPGTRVPWALLRVTEPPADGSGTCTCMLFHRYDLVPPPLGYRCLKLGTTTGPLKIRVSQVGGDGESLPLREALDVGVSPNGFKELKSPIQGIVPAETGVFDSSLKGGTFEHVAFVRIKANPDDARVPVEIMGEGFVDIRVNHSDDKGLLVTFKRDAWIRGIHQIERMQANIFEELMRMAAKPENRGDALARAKTALDRFRSDVTNSRNTGNELGKEFLALNRPIHLDADFKRLTDIEDKAKGLTRFIEGLQKAEQEENSPERKRWIQMLNDGRIAEKAGDFEQAIAIYEKLLSKEVDPIDKEVFEQLKQNTAKLKEFWNPKSPAHQNARLFLTKTFPAMTFAEAKGQIKEIKDAVEELKKAEDRFFLPKFFQELDLFAQKMKDKRASLKANESVEDREQLELIRDLSKALEIVQKDVAQSIEALRKKE